MKNALVVMAVALLSLNGLSQSKKKKVVAGYSDNNYEIICEGVGKQGTKLIKVYSYGKKPEAAALLAKKNAIHGIIFRGVQNSANGCQGVRALASSPTLEQSRADFFEPFFSPGGKYLNYISLSAQGGNNREVIKVDKKTYKVGITMSVMYDVLRKDLERAGIVKGLASGF